MTSAPTYSHAHRLARGTLAQQGAQVVSILAGLTVATVLGRTLTLTEFGVWGLTLSLVGYLSFVQGSVDTAALREIGKAQTKLDRDRAFSAAVVTYIVAGAITGLALTLGGLALLGIFDIPDELRPQARDGLIALGVIMALGWPARVFRVALQGVQRFGIAALCQAIAYSGYVATMLILVLSVKPPLWVLIGSTGFLPAGVGIICGVAFIVLRMDFRFRPKLLDRNYLRMFSLFSGSVLTIAVTEVITFQLDRAVLGIFRSAATVGLYEAAIRPSTFMRQLQGTLSITVFPASAGFIGQQDDVRLRELLLRGTRSVMAVTIPVGVLFIVLSQPILEAWLGPPFDEAALATSILTLTWVVTSGIAIGATMSIAAGRVRRVMIYSWGVALLNLGISLALTPRFGLEGVVAGTTAAYILMLPVVIRIITSGFGIRARDMAREAWLPALSLGAALALALAALRISVGVEGAAALIATSLLALSAYWGLYWVIWSTPAERALVKSLVRSPGRRSSDPP